MPKRSLAVMTISKSQAMATARAMYEVKGETLDFISVELGVAVNTLRKWSLKDNWRGQRGVYAPKVAELTRQNFIEQAALKGLTPELVLNTMLEGLTKANKDYIVGEKDGQITTLFEGKPDYSVRQKYLHEYLSAAGIAGNNGNGLQISANGEGNVNVQINMPGKKDTSK